MSGKKSRRVPHDLKAVQDERLTCRHIQTLMQLQQATDENEELKNKLQVLENEIMSCQELHKIARDSERTLQQMKKDCQQMTESSLNELKEIHAKKNQELIDSNYQLRKASERKQQELEAHIHLLQNANEDLVKKLECFTDEQQSAEALEQRLKDALSNLSLAENARNKLQLELAAKKKTEEANISEKQKYLSTISSLEKTIEDISLKLKSEMDSKKKLIEQSDLLKELDKQRSLAEALQKDKEICEEKLEELTIQISDYKMKVKSLERTNMILELERDALNQSSTDLRKEVEYLKEKEAGHKSSCSDFNEYVSIKREVASLKEENIKLKNSKSKIEIKTLKADDTRTTRGPKSASGLKRK